VDNLDFSGLFQDMQQTIHMTHGQPTLTRKGGHRWEGQPGSGADMTGNDEQKKARGPGYLPMRADVGYIGNRHVGSPNDMSFSPEGILHAGMVPSSLSRYSLDFPELLPPLCFHDYKLYFSENGKNGISWYIV
jgi:hypothetical protein